MGRIFLTGATGYVGGDVFYRLQQSSLAKSHMFSCLVRDPDKAKELSEKYPRIEIIQGDLDDSDLIVKEARKADVVLSRLAESLNRNPTLTILQISQLQAMPVRRRLLRRAYKIEIPQVIANRRASSTAS